jgi:hypothetical protein
LCNYLKTETKEGENIAEYSRKSEEKKKEIARKHGGIEKKK